MKLDSSLQYLIELYNEVGPKTRNMKYFAKWVYKVYKDLFYLPCVEIKYKDQLAIDKTIFSIFAILVDDLADNFEFRNERLLRIALKIPYSGKKHYKNKYLNVTKKVWDTFFASVKKYPRYKEFKKIFFFDLDQFNDAIKYSFLVNSMNIGNELEFKIYSPHNMAILVFLDMDLMCSPKFDINELWKFREVMYYIQDICHIGNILNTYPREIQEKDFSSPIINIGVRKNIITKEEVIQSPQYALKKLKTLEKDYKKRVKEDFKKINTLGKDIKTINIPEFSRKLEKVFEAFLRRGKYWEIKNTKNP